MGCVTNRLKRTRSKNPGRLGVRRPGNRKVKLRVEFLPNCHLRIVDEKGKELILDNLDFTINSTTLNSNMTLFRRNNGRWHVRFMLNGQRVMRITGESDYDKAFLKAGEIIKEALSPKRTPPVVTFSQLAKEFEKDIIGRCTPKTVDNDRGRLKRLRVEFGNKRVIDITQQHLTDYLKQRRENSTVRIIDGTRKEKRIEPNTVNREPTTIKLIFKFAEEKGYIAIDPAIKIKSFPTVQNPPDLRYTNERRGLTEDELTRLLEACKLSDNPILYEIVKVAVLSGLRKGELQRLIWEDVDFTRNTLRVCQSKTKTVFFKPIPKELLTVFLSLKNKDSRSRYVFSKSDGSAYGDWRRSFKTACRWTGLEDVCFHMLRHTCFSMLGDRGFNDLEIQAYSGHKSLAMVRRYTHISPKHVQEMANTLDLTSGAKVVQSEKGS